MEPLYCEDGEYDYFDYFHGAVPPRMVFETQIHFLEKAFAVFDEFESDDPRIRTMAEVSFIGLASYFEAYCKDLFASIVNICPELMHRFIKIRGEVSLNASSVLKLLSRIDLSVGSIVAERYDFGSAKSINSLFHDLLRITPFSTKEARRFGDFLEDRNILVHHGGILTTRYSKRPSSMSGNRPLLDSLVIRKAEFETAKEFLTAVAIKMSQASHQALRGFLHEADLDLSTNALKAVDALAWTDDGIAPTG